MKPNIDKPIPPEIQILREDKDPSTLNPYQYFGNPINMDHEYEENIYNAGVRRGSLITCVGTVIIYLVIKVIELVYLFGW